VAALQTALPKLLTAKSSEVAIAALEAAALLRARDAGAEAFAMVGRRGADGKVRGAALKTLAAIDDPRAAEAVRLAVADRDVALRVEAHGLLGKFNPAEAADQLAKAFPTAGVTEKKAIIAALGEIKSAAAGQLLAGLFAELKTGKIPKEALLELLEAAGKRGGAELKAHLEAYQNSLPSAEPLAKYEYALAGGDKENGEKLFQENAVAQCARCHQVDGAGGEAGPELTGIAAKKDRRYLLESIVNPNAQIAEGFQTVMITLKNNDIKAGIVKEETGDHVTLQMPIPGAPSETVKKTEIKLRENAPSGMPPGMGEMLTKRELRDILEYVASLTSGR
jgi:quinoprotein glucose dehydrogenase